jgi:hypothetical protein
MYLGSGLKALVLTTLNLFLMKMCRENSKLDIDACCVFQAVSIFTAYFNAG